MDTNHLIEALKADLKPVERLPAPWRRMIEWLAIGVPAVAIVALADGLRPDLSERLADPLFLTQVIAVLSTAVLAGWAAMSAVVPGAPRWVFWAPAAPLVGWIATMGQQCWEDWVRWGAAGLDLPVVDCAPEIIMAGIVPAIAMIVMLRKGAPCESCAAVFWGTLASAALANAGLRLFHMHDAGVILIVWQFGAVLAFTTVATLLKDRLLSERGRALMAT